MTTRTFLRNDGQFAQVDAGSISISTTTTTGFLTYLAASLGSSVALSTSAFTDGPSVAQGSSGTWYASGTVMFQTATVNGTAEIQLWDGTTAIDNAFGSCTVANLPVPVSLSGVISSPAGNIRISGVLNSAIAGGFNATGGTITLSKLSTITAIRIG